MTNTEILRAPREVLGQIERQRRYILEIAQELMGCPACHTKSNQIQANDTSQGDVDKFPWSTVGEKYHCPGCHRELIHAVYFLGGHGWHLTEEEAAKLKPEPATP